MHVSSRAVAEACGVEMSFSRKVTSERDRNQRPHPLRLHYITLTSSPTKTTTPQTWSSTTRSSARRLARTSYVCRSPGALHLLSHPPEVSRKTAVTAREQRDSEDLLIRVTTALHRRPLHHVRGLLGHDGRQQEEDRAGPGYQCQQQGRGELHTVRFIQGYISQTKALGDVTWMKLTTGCTDNS